MARRSTRSESASRRYAEQIMRSAQQLTHEAISLAYLIDRVPIDLSLGKRLGPKVRGIRDLLNLAQAELRAVRLEHLAAKDPLARNGSGAKLAEAIAEQAYSCSLSERYALEPRLAKWRRARRAGARTVAA